MNTNITVITGAVHTGKSTNLSEWCVFQRLNDKVVRGLLNPEWNGVKHFVNANSNERFEMQAEENEADIIEVGKYRFSQNAFERAREIIAEESSIASDYFIVDEIGKLELAGDGLEPAISEVINHLGNLPIGHLILVIRDYLLEEAIKHYRIEAPKIISKDELLEI